MDILAKLFGGQARVRIMRLFILNNDNFDIEEIISHSRVTRANVRKELNILKSLGFIKQKTITREGARGGKKKVTVWSLNPFFAYLEPIKEILVDPDLLVQDDLAKRFKQIGRIKLLIISGVFMGEEQTRADLLVVADKINKTSLNQVIKSLEAEIGKELTYVVFNSKELKYRLDMYDKLVCDILEEPHKKLIDMGLLSSYIPKK